MYEIVLSEQHLLGRKEKCVGGLFMNCFKKTGTMTLVLSSLIVFALVVAGCGGGAKPAEPAKTAAPVKWVANSVWPPANHQSVGLTEFAKRAKEATKGKVDITVQTGGALGYKGPELLKAVRDGLVPVSDMLTSGVAGDERPLALAGPNVDDAGRFRIAQQSQQDARFRLAGGVS